jgi:hypothetical protein
MPRSKRLTKPQELAAAKRGPGAQRIKNKEHDNWRWFLGITATVFVKGVVVTLAALAILWSVLIVPTEHKVAPLEQIVEHIGETFTPAAFKKIEGYADRLERLGGCYNGPDAIAAVRLRKAALVLAYGPTQELPEDLWQARNALRSALACTPLDAYFWYALFRIELARTGDVDICIPYIEMSYRLAPNEGWISPQRSRVSLPLLSRLDPDIRALVLLEYTHMVRDQASIAAKILVKANEGVRATLVSLLTSLPLSERTRIARLVEDADANIAIPGVVQDDTLPAWQRGYK